MQRGDAVDDRLVDDGERKDVIFTKWRTQGCHFSSHRLPNEDKSIDGAWSDQSTVHTDSRMLDFRWAATPRIRRMEQAVED